uniref:Adhesion G-protein coupled receptor G7 n=1 Tax=Saimiri boliviensis boliviensis TaxID=39432 RepID=A0A2K6TWX7_SAIBB
MVSCRAWNLRVLVAVVCGLLTGIVLGLGIWRIVVRIRRGTSAPSSGIPTEFCRNGGTWENGRCICTEEWKGLRCTMANFCENSTYMNFTFARIPVGRYGPSLETCDKSTPNVGEAGASLLNNISSEVQILTSNASMLTSENIVSATQVIGQIFNTSRNASPEAKKVAVVTVSQLLDASEEAFQSAVAADNDDPLTTLIEQMENYSLSLGNQSVVEPNIAIRSANFSTENTPSRVLFSVKKGASGSLVSGSTHLETDVNTLNPDENTELQILLNMKEGRNSTACGFVVYQNDKLFQSKSFIAKSSFSQKIISSKTDGNEEGQSASVEMAFSPKYNRDEFQLNSYACVYWNFATKDWDTHGCHKQKGADRFLHCHCNHTTNFAVLMTFKKDYQYPKSLDVLSNVGCALSITGLALTIIFQVVTRKVRKTSVTWVLVSLCVSMLIFNLLFVFGIENSNKNLKTSDDAENTDVTDNVIPKTDTVSTPNPTCTAAAALLHYFLLGTFTWNALSAAQLYFLLIRTMKPLPRHFILVISLIGWGVPAIVVAITVGVVYSQNGKNPEWELEYRQEEICWLAIPESKDVIKSPLLWSFIVPVAIILISNIVIFIIISIKVLWKNNQNLTSTKKVSSAKKTVSTLSVAVVFGITWILAYLMLINDDSIRIVFSYIFCLFNTTQGLQIFILYTVRTKIFQSEASKVLTSLSSATRMKSLPSMTRPRLRIKMYNFLRSLPTVREHFRLLEPSVSTEDVTLSESDQAKESA